MMPISDEMTDPGEGMKWVKELGRAVLACKKCGATSGDYWTQCRGACPIPFSPHYKRETPLHFETPISAEGFTVTGRVASPPETQGFAALKGEARGKSADPIVSTNFSDLEVRAMAHLAALVDRSALKALVESCEMVRDSSGFRAAPKRVHEVTPTMWSAWCKQIKEARKSL